MKTNAKVTTDLKDAVKVIKSGGVVVFPTGTSYGIGCDATNFDAVERVKNIKNRSSDLPLLTIVRDMRMAEKYGVFSDMPKKIAKKHWPGPLTIVVPQVQGKLASNIAKNNTVGVRISSNGILKSIMELIDVPLVATSANISGSPPTYKIEDAIAQFSKAGPEPDLYFDGGELEVTPPSMVIEASGGEIIVHRQGPFKIEV